jgi:hypothetical protein
MASKNQKEIKDKSPVFLPTGDNDGRKGSLIR